MIGPDEAWPADRDEQAALWCITLSEGDLSSEERVAFDRWIGQPGNLRAFEEASRPWNGIDAAVGTPELIRLRSTALEHFRRAHQRRWMRRAREWPVWTAVAAMVLMVMFATMMLGDASQRFQTGVGERRIVILSDGSKVSLDAETTVEVRLGKDRRALTLLRGRAKFDVARDALRPFAVTAGDKMVVATGTAFSVEMLDQRVHVLLYEGHVAVLDTNRNAPVTRKLRRGGPIEAADIALLPGRELIAPLESAAPATIATADPVRSLSWEAGQLSFDDVPLGAAVAQMNRYATDKLVVADPAAEALPVNGVFTAGDTAAFVEAVTALHPLRVARAPGTVTLKSN